MSEILDTAFALEKAGGDEGLAKELFSMLLGELPELHKKLQIAIEAKDMQAMWDHAHKLYGSTAYCGVPALRDTVQALESAIKQQDFDRINSEFQITSNEIGRLVAEGDSLLQQVWS